MSEESLFSVGSSSAVMAALDLLTAKHPNKAVRLISSPLSMEHLKTFYVTKVSESAIQPCMAITQHGKSPCNVEVCSYFTNSL